MSTAVYYIEVNMICIVTLGLLLGSFLIGEYKSRRGTLYKILLVLTMVMSAADLVSGVFRGASFAGAALILWISNMLYLISSVFIGYVWILYSMQVLSGKLNRPIQFLALVLSIADSILIASAPLNGWIFAIDSGNLYHRGSLVIIHWVLMYAFELIPSIVAPFTRADWHEKRAISLFIILPMVASVVQSVFYGVSSSQAGLTGGMILLYIMLQNREMNEAKIKAELLDEISNTDTLTGLNNRRAYEARLESMKKHQWVGVIFMDLNGLKATNDTQGHKAGDAMICRFAQLLRGYFMAEYIFRISGDEFVILCADKTIFEERYNAMRKEMADDAAAGCTQGMGKDVVQLVTDAEKMMYADKSAYYIRTGKDRRARS